MAQLKIDLIVDDKGSIVVKDFGGNVTKSLNTASTSVAGLDSRLSAIQKTIGVGLAAGAAIGVAGIVGLTKVMSDAVELAKVQEEAEAKLGAVLQTTGEAAGYNLQQMKDMAGAMQSVTTVGDETIIAGQAILATFKNIRGEGFEKATMAALDMSTVMGTDLKSSMTQVGKALNDPIKGLSALSRVGVSFTEEQKEQIKVLQESGDIMGAQAVILAELEGEFGGAAAALRDTFGGSVTAAKNALGDMQEQLGYVITKNQFFIEAAKLAEQTFISWTKGIGDNEDAMMELSKTIVVGVVGALDGLVTGVEAVHLGWTMLKSAIPVVANTMVAATDLMFAGLRNLLLPLDGFFMAMEKAADFMGKEFVNPLDAIQAKLDAVGSVTKGVMEESFQDIIDVKEGYDKLHGAIGTIKTSLENLDVKRAETADIARKTEQETTATVVVETAKQTAARDKEQAAQLKLAEDLHDKLNQLTLSTYEYKVSKIDEEIAKMQEVAGADRQLQDDIVAYRKLKLAELGEYSNMYNRQEQ